MKKTELIAVATISKLYGAEGEVALNLFDSFPDDVILEEPLFIYCDGLVVPLFLSSFKFKGSSKAVALFDDVDTNLRISEFIGAKLYANSSYAVVDEDEESDDDELYYEELIGYEMFDLNSGRKGKVIDFIEHKHNPLFIVEYEDVQIMVPACDDIIQDIYVDALVVEALIPEGLYDFYKK